MKPQLPIECGRFAKLPVEVRKIIYDYLIEAYDHTQLKVEDCWYFPAYQVSVTTPFVGFLRANKTIHRDFKQHFIDDHRQITFYAKLDLKHYESGKRYYIQDFRTRASAKWDGPLELHVAKLSWSAQEALELQERRDFECARDATNKQLWMTCGGMDDARKRDMGRWLGWSESDLEEAEEGEDDSGYWSDNGPAAQSLTENEIYARKVNG
jgi:hypothetical protein